MSMGVVESLALERVEGEADLFVISGGGMEDMVVEGRPARRVGTLRLGFLTVAFSLGRARRGCPNARSREIVT